MNTKKLYLFNKLGWKSLFFFIKKIYNKLTNQNQFFLYIKIYEKKSFKSFKTWIDKYKLLFKDFVDSKSDDIFITYPYLLYQICFDL